MSDASRRAIRSLAQFIVAGGLAGLTQYASQNTIAPFWLLVIQAAYMLAVTWAQNELEDRGAIPAVLKAPASSGVDPAPDNAGPAK